MNRSRDDLCWMADASETNNVMIENMHVLRFLLPITTVALGVYCFYAPAAMPRFFVTLITAIHAGMTVLVFGRSLRSKTRTIHALCLIFEASLCAVLVASALQRPSEPAVLYAPFLLGISLSLALPFAESAGLIGLTTAIFMGLAAKGKPEAVFRADCVSAVTAYALCLSLNLLAGIARRRKTEMQASLRRLSRIDPLTGLLNKFSTENAAMEYLNENGSRKSAALLIMDLDHFKLINDSTGHQAGDEALCEVGARLQRLFREQDIVGRIGGDEFLALLMNVSDRTLVARRCEQILEELRSIQLARTSIQLTCSIGVAFCPEDGCDYETLFGCADARLYEKKTHGKDGYLLK